jgi:hypothetical protein
MVKSNKLKNILVVLIFVIPSLIMVFIALRQREHKKESFAPFESIFHDWKKGTFVSLTNEDLIQTSTSNLIEQAENINLLSPEQKHDLHGELVRGFKGFSAAEFADFWAFRCPSNYSEPLRWNQQSLNDLKRMMPTSSQVQEAIAEGKVPNPERVRGYSLDTDENLFHYAWIGLTDARTQKSHKRIYCDDSWRAVAFDESKIWIGTNLPTLTALVSSEKHVGIYSKPATFAFAERCYSKSALGCNVRLIISGLDDFEPIYTVYLQFSYDEESKCWLPIALCAGISGERVNYIF